MQLKVFKAAGMTLAFLFQHILDVLRIVWLPAALQVAGFFLLLPGYLRAFAEIGIDPPADLGEIWSRIAPTIAPALLFLAIVLATSSAMVSGLTRLIVRGERPRLPFYLGWSADEWRILGGWVALFLINAGLQAVLAVASLLVRGLMSLGPGPGVILTLVVFLVGVVCFIWISVRLSMLAPATIALKKIALGDSWESTEENFWNLVGFWLIWVGTALVLQLMLTGYLTPPGYFDAFRGADFTPEGMRAATRKANEAVLRGYDFSDMSNVMRMLVSYLLGAGGAIITAIAGAVCWRTMTDAPADPENSRP